MLGVGVAADDGGGGRAPGRGGGREPLRGGGGRGERPPLAGPPFSLLEAQSFKFAIVYRLARRKSQTLP